MKSIVLVGEAQGENEARLGRGFVGNAGLELLKQMDEAGLLTLTSEDWSYIKKWYNSEDPSFLDCVWQMHPEFHRTNVIQRRPPGNKFEEFCGTKAEGIIGYPSVAKSKYLRREFIPELERLADEIVEADPNLIIALGNVALWALCGCTGIGKQRGTTRLSTHTAIGYKVLPTYHPSGIFQQWSNRPLAVVDLMKAKREAEFPEIRRPRREIWIEPTLDDLFEFEHLYIRDFLSTDIENPGGPITEIGFAPSPSVGLVLPFVDPRKPGRSYWRTLKEEQAAWGWAKRQLENRKILKVFQNGLYDVTVLWRQYGIRTYGFDHDTMILHHSLQPESLKSLQFLGSIYTDEGNWKDMRKFKASKRED